MSFYKQVTGLLSGLVRSTKKQDKRPVRYRKYFPPTYLNRHARRALDAIRRRQDRAQVRGRMSKRHWRYSKQRKDMGY